MVSEIVQAGIVPGAIEMMDKLAIEASEQMAHAGWPTDARRGAAGRARRPERECEARFDEVVAICERCGSDDVRVARDDAERQLFWKTRKAAFPAMGRISPELLRPGRRDPPHAAPGGARAHRRAREEYGLRVANVFHAGDGNLHPLVCYDGRVEGEAERAEELAGLIVDACVDAGGSITGEHGVGVDKKRYMPEDVRRARPGGVPAPALRVRPGRAGQPRQGHAHAAAVRRGAGPLPPPPARVAGLAERF